MKARPTDQRRLLELAALDADIAAADHARRNPPHAARVKELVAQRQTQQAELTRLLGERDDLNAEMTRVESDVALVQARTDRDTTLLAATSNPKEAQGLERELASLAKRRSDLEDAQLELMEGIERADAEVAAQEAVIAVTQEEGVSLSTEAKAAVAAATARFEAATSDRAAVATTVPADLLAAYERLAARGVGAGALRQRTCGGCHMVLSGTDLATLRTAAEDDVVHCPECGCILVRTDESGL